MIHFETFQTILFVIALSFAVMFLVAMVRYFKG